MIGTQNKFKLTTAMLLGVSFAGTNLSFGQGKVPAKPASNVKPAPAAANPANLPSIVATVNGESITRDELAALSLARYGDQVIENVLNKYLILQACQSQNIRISQKDIDDEIARIAGKFNLSTTLYLKLIEDERDITAEQYAADIVWPMLALRQLAHDKVKVDPAEVQAMIDSEYGRKVQVRMIAVEDKTKAAQIHAQAAADPESFKQLAKQHSEDSTSASVEGLLPPIRKTRKGDALENAAFSLKPNQVSALFEIANMHVCLQCVRFLDAAILTPDQIPLVEDRIRRDLEDQQLRELSENMFTTLRDQAAVQVVFNNASLQAQYPSVAALINRQPIPMKTLEDETIKRFGPAVLENEINRRILLAAAAAAGVQVSESELFDEVARAADYYGFLKDDGAPDVDAWLEKVLRESNVSQAIYLDDVVWPTVALKKLVANQVTVTDKDLQESYEYDYGPRAEVLAIVCSNQRTAQEVWQMARDKPTDQFFGELAAQYSVEPTSRSNYGKIPPIRSNAGQPTLENAAFKLQTGELSGIVELAGQYVILRGQGRTQPVVTDRSVVQEELSKDVLERKTRKAMQVQLESLIASASIDNFLVPKSQLGTAATAASHKEMKSQQR